MTENDETCLTSAPPEAPRYVRIQVRYCGKLGLPVGIFGACHHLRRAGRLSAQEDQLFSELDSWFDRELPTPPFYEDGNSIGAITWFKSTAVDLIEALGPLRELLERHKVPYDVVRTDDPGRVVYEDAFQVAVVDAKFPVGHVTRDEPSLGAKTSAPAPRIGAPQGLGSPGSK